MRGTKEVIFPVSLYDRLGGEEGVEATVEVFYERIMDDQELRPFFSGVNMNMQRRHQVGRGGGL